MTVCMALWLWLVRLKLESPPRLLSVKLILCFEIPHQHNEIHLCRSQVRIYFSSCSFSSPLCLSTENPSLCCDVCSFWLCLCLWSCSGIFCIRVRSLCPRRTDYCCVCVSRISWVWLTALFGCVDRCVATLWSIHCIFLLLYMRGHIVLLKLVYDCDGWLVGGVTWKIINYHAVAALRPQTNLTKYLIQDK